MIVIKIQYEQYVMNYLVNDSNILNNNKKKIVTDKRIFIQANLTLNLISFTHELTFQYFEVFTSIFLFKRSSLYIIENI